MKVQDYGDEGARRLPNTDHTHDSTPYMGNVWWDCWGMMLEKIQLASH